MEAALVVLMRFVHITSVVTLLGAVVYARFAVWPALSRLADAQRQSVIDQLVIRYRGYTWATIVGLLISGIYNYLSKDVYPPRYHMVIGIKFLLALHIFAVALLLVRSGGSPEKRARWMSGVVVSGVLVLAISAYLRWLTLYSR